MEVNGKVLSPEAMALALKAIQATQQQKQQKQQTVEKTVKKVPASEKPRVQIWIADFAKGISVVREVDVEMDLSSISASDHEGDVGFVEEKTSVAKISPDESSSSGEEDDDDDMMVGDFDEEAGENGKDPCKKDTGIPPPPLDEDAQPTTPKQFSSPILKSSMMSSDDKKQLWTKPLAATPVKASSPCVKTPTRSVGRRASYMEEDEDSDDSESKAPKAADKKNEPLQPNSALPKKDPLEVSEEAHADRASEDSVEKTKPLIDTVKPSESKTKIDPSTTHSAETFACESTDDNVEPTKKKKKKVKKTKVVKKKKIKPPKSPGTTTSDATLAARSEVATNGRGLGSSTVNSPGYVNSTIKGELEKQKQEQMKERLSSVTIRSLDDDDEIVPRGGVRRASRRASSTTLPNRATSLTLKVNRSTAEVIAKVAGAHASEQPVDSSPISRKIPVRSRSSTAAILSPAPPRRASVSAGMRSPGAPRKFHGMPIHEDTEEHLTEEEAHAKKIGWEKPSWATGGFKLKSTSQGKAVRSGKELASPIVPRSGGLS